MYIADDGETVPKRLIDLDDDLLAAAKRELNTTGVSDTVRTALQQAAAKSARARQIEWLERGGSESMADPDERGEVWCYRDNLVETPRCGKRCRPAGVASSGVSDPSIQPVEWPAPPRRRRSSLQCPRAGRIRAVWADRRAAYEYLPTNDEDWQSALSAQRELARHGQHQAVGVADLLTATLAAADHLTVVHYDADFETAATVLAFQHQWVLPRGSL